MGTHSSNGQLDYDIRPPAPKWRVALAVIAALALVGTMVFAASGAFGPKPANAAAITAEDCATAFGYSDRTAEERAWLQLCMSALRPGPAPTTPPASASASPTAGPSASPSVSPTPPAPPVETATYTTSGKFLKDPRGANVLVRGAEQVTWNASWLPTSLVTQQGNCGSNTMRILPYYQMATPIGDPRNTLAQIEDMIKRGINAHMMVDVAIDKGESPAVYLRPEVKTMLFKYQKWIVIHAVGENYAANDNAWVANANSVVAQMRAAGYTTPLYVYAPTAGRELPVILRAGQRVVDADPLHRIVFGWQAYWGPNNYYQNLYGMTLEQAFQAVANAPFPIQVGMIRHADMQDNDPASMDFRTLMRRAFELGIGWLWWDWRMSPDDLTTDGVCGHWAHDGADIVQNNLYGIQKTSIRTPFQLAQVAPV